MTPVLFDSCLDQLGSEINIAFILLFIFAKVHAAQCVEFLACLSKVDDNLVSYLSDTFSIPIKFFTELMNDKYQTVVDLLHSDTEITENTEKPLVWNEESRQQIISKCQETINSFENQGE